MEVRFWLAALVGFSAIEGAIGDSCVRSSEAGTCNAADAACAADERGRVEAILAADATRTASAWRREGRDEGWLERVCTRASGLAQLELEPWEHATELCSRSYF